MFKLVCKKLDDISIQFTQERRIKWIMLMKRIDLEISVQTGRICSPQEGHKGFGNL
jgi:hypothetical protein